MNDQPTPPESYVVKLEYAIPEQIQGSYRDIVLRYMDNTLSGFIKYGGMDESAEEALFDEIEVDLLSRGELDESGNPYESSHIFQDVLEILEDMESMIENQDSIRMLEMHHFHFYGVEKLKLSDTRAVYKVDYV